MISFSLLFAFVAMIGVALAFLLTPLLRGGAKASADRSSYDLDVYRDQLAEVGRDVERGLLAADEAVAARVEIERRMLSLADGVAGGTREGAPEGKSLPLVFAIAGILPVAALGLYVLLGSPGLPGQPFAGRQAERLGLSEVDSERVVGLVGRLAARLAADPSDGEGWAVLGRSYRTLGKYREAAQAYGQAIERGVRSAEILTTYGEMLTLSEDGAPIPEPARKAFLMAYHLDANGPIAQYYLGLAAAQDGEMRRALAIWRHLERNSPPGAPWLSLLKDRIDTVAQELGVDPGAVEPAPPSD
ncbi:MAG: c-type cytochrome biogenesis protein CcmI [Alphaproteobacteria bacterium]